MEGINIYGLFRDMFKPVTDMVYFFFLFVVVAVVGGVILFFVSFCIIYHVNPIRSRPKYLASLEIEWLPYDLFRWVLYDFKMRDSLAKEFSEYGFTIFVGRQGSGKTISMVNYLRRMRKRYPNCIIVTNFRCSLADHQMEDWRDFMEIRNGVDGVIFAIDEIHSEYSAEKWNDFPETLLSEISMQRKQRVKIVATAQVFSRCAKQIREQAFSVVACNTLFNRLTMCREYDAAEYATSDTPYMVKKRCRPISKVSFVQSNKLRECYDTYEKIERMDKTVFSRRRDR